MHMHYTWGQLGPSFTHSKQHGSLGKGCGCSTLLRAFLSSRQTLSPLCMRVFSLKSFSFPKPKRGSHSYLDISKCSLSFPGQPSKSGLLYLKFKNLSSRYACTSLIMVCFCLFYFFFPFCALINHSLDFHALFQLRQFFCDIKFGNLRFLGSLLKLPVHRVWQHSGAKLKGICLWMCRC